MSSMNFMEKLLDGVEVEWKAMGDVCHVASGGTPSTVKKEYWDNGDIPWLKSESCNNESVYAADNFITELGLKNSSTKILGKDTTLIALVGATIFKTAYLEFEAATNQNIASIKSKDCKLLIDKFVFYYITNLYDELKTKMRNYGMLNLSTLRQFKIPIPCLENPERSLEIQAEIVRILDAFTKLTAELTAELTARKKQYNHYRDQLLSFEEGDVEWKTLGEVATIGTGSHDTQDAIEDGGYIFYARGREPLRLNVFDFDETAIITAGDGAGVGKVFHYAQGKYALHQRAYRIVPSEVMDPRFVYHCIRSYFYAYIQKASVISSVTSLRRPMFLKFPIPVPSLAEQARIVAILDKFDSLTDSISEGLPREIALRQKQYEYYRNLLLSFPKPEEVAA